MKVSILDYQEDISPGKPSVVMLQETKLYRKGTYKMENFCIFEKIRDINEGGGLMTIIHENSEPVLIPTKDS